MIMREYVRLVDSGAIEVTALEWNYFGLGVLLLILGWLLYDAIRTQL